ncbi:MAG TPA: hypothetical protein VM938_09385 [Acidimicrobiales bacterium]|nr:hypothetical protein [Acidimicrobiales bacterium]
MLADPTPDTFRPHVGTPFSIEVEGGDPLVLTLEEVQAHAGGHEQRAEPFTLVFSGPADRQAPQATLRLTHQAIGAFDLFIVPTGVGRYEAVFN